MEASKSYSDGPGTSVKPAHETSTSMDSSRTGDGQAPRSGTSKRAAMVSLEGFLPRISIPDSEYRFASRLAWEASSMASVSTFHHPYASQLS